MGARDDYPVMNEATANVAFDREAQAALDEIDNLRRWKYEAMQVFAEWDECVGVLVEAGHPPPLGLSRARHVAGYIKIAVATE